MSTPGIMEVSPRLAVGPGVADLDSVPDQLPDYGWVHRYEAYTIPLDPGATVLQWQDLIGSAPAVRSGTSTPILEDDGSRLAVAFDGADYMTIGVPRPQPHTVVIAVTPSVVTAGARTLVAGGSATPNRGTVYLDGANWRMTAGVAFTHPVPAIAGQSYIVTAVFNGADSVLRVNGIEQAGNAGTETAGTTILGALPGPSTLLMGSLIGVHISNRVLTAPERAAFEGALRSAYGV